LEEAGRGGEWRGGEGKGGEGRNEKGSSAWDLTPLSTTNPLRAPRLMQSTARSGSAFAFKPSQFQILLILLVVILLITIV
jgi:hypothetical protein